MRRDTRHLCGTTAALALSAVLIAGCTSTAGGGFPAGGDGGTDGGGTVSNGVAALSVSAATQSIGAATLRPAAGSEFVVIRMSLTNQASAEPLSLAAPLFGITTDSGLQYRGDARTSLVKDGCDPKAMLTQGHSVECVLIFETPLNAGATALSYRLPDSTSVSAPVNLTRCDRCGGVCTDLKNDPNNCGTCGNKVSPLRCVDGKASCSLSTDTLCGTTCVNVATNSNHCGGCDRKCSDGTCEGGKCYRDKNTTSRVSCATLCGSTATCRESAVMAWYTNTACGDRVVTPPTYTCTTTPAAQISDSSGGCGIMNYVGIECQCGT